ncbi:MAG: hypothetical protein U1F15_06190 [Burkholderiales bacterium]
MNDDATPRYTRYDMPMQQVPAGAGAGPPGPAGTATVQGAEVCQVVQDLTHKVPLIAGKPAIARVYVDSQALAGKARVTGEIAWKKGTSNAETYLPASNSIVLDPAAPHPVNARRLDTDHSLQFQLPAAAVAAGKLKLRLKRLSILGGADIPLQGPVSWQVTFRKAPPLRVRVIGLRYRNAQGATRSPEAIHFTYLRSFLARAYPVADVQWSQAVVDADFTAPFDANTVLAANAQLAAIRSREVSSGTHPLTHYYGLVDDAGGQNFMRGRAFDVPAEPRPDTVASGPAGTPGGFAGDHDLSYADWYGAHEIGHTFGRFHPGFPVGQQDRSDTNFPFFNGQLADPDDRYVGFDFGDPALGFDMKVLPGQQWHDIMTYADNQWMSQYTYEAILERLVAESKLV